MEQQATESVKMKAMFSKNKVERTRSWGQNLLPRQRPEHVKNVKTESMSGSSLGSQSSSSATSMSSKTPNSKSSCRESNDIVPASAVPLQQDLMAVGIDCPAPRRHTPTSGRSPEEEHPRGEYLNREEVEELPNSQHGIRKNVGVFTSPSPLLYDSPTTVVHHPPMYQKTKAAALTSDANVSGNRDVGVSKETEDLKFKERSVKRDNSNEMRAAHIDRRQQENSSPDVSVEEKRVTWRQRQRDGPMHASLEDESDQSAQQDVQATAACPEVDFYMNPTVLARLIQHQKYEAAIRRVEYEQYIPEAKIWLVAKKLVVTKRTPNTGSSTAPEEFGVQRQQQQQPSSPRSNSVLPTQQQEQGDEGCQEVYSLRQLPLHLACANLSRCKEHNPNRPLLEKLICILVLCNPQACSTRDFPWGRLPLHEALYYKAAPTTISSLLIAYPGAAQERDYIHGGSSDRGSGVLPVDLLKLRNQQQGSSSSTSSNSNSNSNGSKSREEREQEEIQALLTRKPEFWDIARQEVNLRMKHRVVPSEAASILSTSVLAGGMDVFGRVQGRKQNSNDAAAKQDPDDNDVFDDTSTLMTREQSLRKILRRQEKYLSNVIENDQQPTGRFAVSQRQAWREETRKTFPTVRPLSQSIMARRLLDCEENLADALERNYTLTHQVAMLRSEKTQLQENYDTLVKQLAEAQNNNLNADHQKRISELELENNDLIRQLIQLKEEFDRYKAAPQTKEQSIVASEPLALVSVHNTDMSLLTKGTEIVESNSSQSRPSTLYENGENGAVKSRTGSCRARDSDRKVLNTSLEINDRPESRSVLQDENNKLKAQVEALVARNKIFEDRLMFCEQVLDAFCESEDSGPDDAHSTANTTISSMTSVQFSHVRPYLQLSLPEKATKHATTNPTGRSHARQTKSAKAGRNKEQGIVLVDEQPCDDDDSILERAEALNGTKLSPEIIKAWKRLNATVAPHSPYMDPHQALPAIQEGTISDRSRDNDFEGDRCNAGFDVQSLEGSRGPSTGSV